MPLYMVQFAYTPQAWAALISVPQDRAAASESSVRHVGGRLIGLYYTPGAEYDGFALFEAPDDAAAAARSRSQPSRRATCEATACYGCSQPRRCGQRSNRRLRRQTLHRSALLTKPKDGFGSMLHMCLSGFACMLSLAH